MREDYMYPHHETTAVFEKTKKSLDDLYDNITNNYEGPIPLYTEQVIHD